MSDRPEADFRDLVEEAPDIIEQFDSVGRYLYVNPAFEKITGIPRDSVIGHTRAELGMPEKIVRCWEDAFAEIRRTMQPVELELSWSTGESSQFFRAKAVPVPRGKPVQQIIVIVHDVTDLRAQQERLKMAMRLGHMGAWEWNVRTGEVIWSSELEELHGRKPHSFGGTFDDFLKDIEPDDVPRVLNQLDTAIHSDDTELRIDYRVRRNDQVICFEGRGRILRDGRGVATRVLGLCVDITYEKRVQEVQLAKEAAEQANQAKDQFIAVLSHELRTPLTPVLAELSALDDLVQQHPQMRESVEMMRRNVEMEARLIDDLLDLTRITRGKLKLHMETVDVHSVLHRALAVWREAFHQKRLRLQLDFTARDYFVRGDSSRLQQVFWNLLSNAIKFTPDGGMISIRTSSNDRERLFIDIADTGIGISHEMLPKLFDAFEQGDPSRTRRFGGLGLGLAICRAVIELHGGAITAQSGGPGRGSRFIVELQTAQPPRIKNDGAVPRSHRFIPARILLVEDHESTARVMSRLLGRDGHHVTIANTVAQALSLARDVPFDLIISDIGLPDGSGLDLMREVKTFSQTKGISLSGYGMEQDIQASRDAGFHEHLIKPVSIPQLEEVITQVLSQKVNHL